MMLRSHIVIEGPDGAGKTTLAKSVCQFLGMEYHHEGPPPRGVDPFHHYMRLLARNKATVFDRLHLGETVYGPMLRGRSMLNASDLAVLNRKARIIICLPAWDVCLVSTRSRREYIIDEAMLHEAYSRWFALTARMAGQVRVFDFTRTHHVAR